MSTLGPEASISTGQAGLGPQDDRPLTDQEYQLLQRLLSDPFSLPMQFKTWLVSYLEGSDLTLPISSVQGLSGALGITGGGSISALPAGIVLPFGGATAPSGTLLCDGTQYLQSDYVRLAGVIGTTFGGDATHFNVPDLRGRTIAFKGLHSDVATIGNSDGAAAANRRPKHQHTKHIHPLSVGGLINYKDGSSGDRSWSATAGGVDGGGSMLSVDGGTGNPNDSVDAPAYLVLNSVITF